MPCKEKAIMPKAHALSITLTLLMAVFLAVPAGALAHCEVPCGIYGDLNRFADMREDIATIEKAMKEIASLSAAKDKNYNQLVRWINTKEMHAGKLQETVWQYFLTQRVKPVPKKDTGYANYQLMLEQLHHLSVYAMKAKQSIDLAVIKKLNALVDEFESTYMPKKK
jgi:nickel superoxide dismutase